MKKNEIVLWAVAILCAVLAVVNIPNTAKLKTVNAQIRQTQLKKKAVATQTAMKSPYSNEFDLKSAEQHAEATLKGAIAKELGDLHSRKDYQANKKQLQAALGKQLTTELVNLNEDPNTKKWVITKNDATMVAFGNADNINKVPVYITTEFEQQDGTKKLYLITLNYDLENLSVNSYQIQVITTNGGNQDGTN
mgnify:FL=1